MKLQLISITVAGRLYSKFLYVHPGEKIDVYKWFPVLNYLPRGTTFTIG